MNKIDLFPTNKNDKYIVSLLDRCATKRELFSVVNLCIKPKAFSNDVMDIYDECFILFDFYNHCNGLSIDTKDNIINLLGVDIVLEYIENHKDLEPNNTISDSGLAYILIMETYNKIY